MLWAHPCLSKPCSLVAASSFHLTGWQGHPVWPTDGYGVAECSQTDDLAACEPQVPLCWCLPTENPVHVRMLVGLVQGLKAVIPVSCHLLPKSYLLETSCLLLSYFINSTELKFLGPSLKSFYPFVLLKTRPRALFLLGKHPTTELTLVT